MYSNRVTRTVAPENSILSIEEVKAHLNVTHADEDAMIARLIDAATAMIDGPNGAGRAMLTQTYRLSLDHVPRTIGLPVNPVQSVTSVTIDGEALSADDYHFDGDTDPAVLTLPYRSTGRLKVEFVAGYGSAYTAVPADLRQAALLIIGHLYDNRSEVGDAKVALPMGATAILNRYR